MNLIESSWLSRSPSVWTRKRLKYAVALINNKAEDDDDSHYLGLEHISSHTGQILNDVPVSSKTGGEGTANLFSEGDILFGKLRPYLAKVARPKTPGRCSSEFLVLRPRWVSNGFLYYFCLADGFLKLVNSSTYGAKMPRANWEFIGNCQITYPDMQSQEAIVDFLDKRTAAVDSLIEKKRRLHELLHEERTALVSQAVTKGLDPTVQMKNIGIPWLGTVPVHWDIQRIKTLIDYSKNGIWGEEPDGDEDVSCVRVADFNRESLQVDATEFTLRSVPRLQQTTRLLKKNDLLLEKSGGGDKQPVGFVISWSLDVPAVCSNFIALCRVRNTVSSRYIAYMFYHLYKTRVNIRSIKQTTGIQNIDQEQYFSEQICIPPEVEQREIAHYLDDVSARSLALQKEILKQVQLLREYRQALITEAVTGKIDVRNDGLLGTME